LAYLGGKQLADVTTFAVYPLFIQLEVLLSLGASAILGLTTALAGSSRPVPQRRDTGSIAALFVVGFLTLPVVAPIALVLALAVERRAERADPDSADRLASDEAGIGLPAGAE
jgi:hypothetical protein